MCPGMTAFVTYKIPIWCPSLYARSRNAGFGTVFAPITKNMALMFWAAYASIIAGVGTPGLAFSLITYRHHKLEPKLTRLCNS
jgi:hypothetical protein